MFDYPPEEVAKIDQGPEKVKTAVLSTTAQAKRRQARKEKQQRRDSMDVDTVTPVTPKIEKGDKMDTDELAVKEDDGEKKEEAEKKEEVKKKEKEKVGYDMKNMSRVLPAQLKYLNFPDTRYQPVKRPVTGGVMVVLDTEPETERETVPLTVSKKVVPPAPTHPGQTTGGAGPIPETPARQLLDAALGGGAAAAAGVLTAVDEDEEGAEEAPVPHEFEYESEGEQDE